MGTGSLQHMSREHACIRIKDGMLFLYRGSKDLVVLLRVTFALSNLPGPQPPHHVPLRACIHRINDTT